MSHHSLLHAPSGAERRMHCPGSAHAEADCPDDDSEESREGTAAHWVKQEIQEGRTPVEGLMTPNGVVVTDEMLEGGEMAADYIRSILPAGVATEVLVKCPKIHEDCWGRPDDFGLAQLNELHIFDYKFGHGYVEVFENAQMVEYASGICDLLPGADARWINFHIIQPRCFSAAPIRTWRVWGEDLRGLWNKLAAIESVAHSPDAPRKAGDHCGNCKARGRCSTLRQAAGHAADTANRGQNVTLEPADLGLELRMLLRAQKILKARIDGLEAQASAELMSGKVVPFFQMKSAAGREKWTLDADTVISAADLLGINIRKPLAAITPAQARKAGMSDEVVAAMSERGASTVKLSEFNDIEARKVFYLRSK